MDVSSTGCHTVVSAGYPDPVDRRSGPPSPSPLVGPTMFSDGSPSFSESNHRWCQNVTSSSDHRGHQKVTSSVQCHPFLNQNHRGHQNVTCRLYTPLYYRIWGRVRRQHYTWSPQTAGSLYQAAGNWTYHNVIVAVTGKRSVLRVYSSSRCKICWSQGRCRLSQMNILFIQSHGSPYIGGVGKSPLHTLHHSLHILHNPVDPRHLDLDIC